MKFKIGDRVRVINKGSNVFGKIGTIKYIDSDIVPYLVEFDEFVDGHNGYGHGKDGHCYWYKKESIKKINDKQYKVIFRDNATILIKDGKKYVAKCCDGDKYDREKGLLVCLAKANGITFKDLQEMLKGAEEQEKKQAGKFKEVKREAKVGEYIKIISAKFNDDCYKNGEIYKVFDRTNAACWGVYIKTTKTHLCCRARREGQSFVRHDEYVVLENYKPYKITLSEFWANKGKKNMAINCKTKGEAKKLLEAFDRVGQKWIDGDSYKEGLYWDDYEGKTLYSNSNGYAKLGGYSNKAKKFKIYDFNEVDLNN